jgi:raffinose/stachyose/melibiose transport system permease protein
LFAAPALVVYALVMLYPSIIGAGSAFTDWSGVGEQRSFVGLENFKELLHDDQALGALRNTLLLTIAIVVVQNGIGLLLALGVHTTIKSRMVLRVIFFAPVVVSPVMVRLQPGTGRGPQRGAERDRSGCAAAGLAG